jgi:hypothetical protein
MVLYWTGFAILMVITGLGMLFGFWPTALILGGLALLICMLNL